MSPPFDDFLAEFTSSLNDRPPSDPVLAVRMDFLPSSP